MAHDTICFPADEPGFQIKITPHLGAATIEIIDLDQIMPSCKVTAGVANWQLVLNAFERQSRYEAQVAENAELYAENKALRETNQRLNRRANGMDGHWQSRAMQAEIMTEMWQRAWKQEFDRMCVGHNELREIHVLVEQARGHPHPKYHSVMDDRFEKATPNASSQIWANVYLNYQKGGVRSERVVDAVRDVLTSITVKSDTPSE